MGPSDDVGALLRSNKRNHTIVKGPDGEIHDCRPAKARKDSDPSSELNKIFSVLGKVLNQQLADRKGSVEEAVQASMLAFIKATNKTPDDLAEACFDPARHMENFVNVVDTAHLVEIDTIVSIYCSKGLNFEPIKFKASMERLGFSYLSANKIYMVMEKWRADAELFTEQKKSPGNDMSSIDVCPSLNSTSSESDEVLLTML